MRPALAAIEWIKVEDGGRRNPPTGEEPPVYWSVVSFPGYEDPNGVMWTLAVRLVKLKDHWLADVYLQIAAAPHHLLSPGTQFELYEGKRRVAVGQVIEPASSTQTE